MSIVRGWVLPRRRRLFVVRLLVVLVTVLLIHLHPRLALVGAVLGMMWIGSLRRLHHGSRLWGRVLALVMLLTRSVGWNLRISGTLRRRHLLISVASRVRLGHIVHAWAAGRNQRRIASVRNRAWTIVKRGIWLLTIIIGRGSASGLLITTAFFIVLVPVLGGLVLAAPHPHVASDADTAALLSNHAAQGCALGQAGELLGGEDGEWGRLDLSTVGDKVVAIEDNIRVFRVQVLDFAQVLEESEA